MCTKEDDQVSLKEIRETFYRLRDFEISNLWQIRGEKRKVQDW